LSTSLKSARFNNFAFHPHERVLNVKCQQEHPHVASIVLVVFEFHPVILASAKSLTRTWPSPPSYCQSEFYAIAHHREAFHEEVIARSLWVEN